MIIHFRKVRWKNILSYGQTFTEILLDRSPSTLITGENGTGKSTVLEAICFSLFGKPFRKINKDQLINTKNGKGLLTEIEFDVGNDSYLIRRGIKPNIFEVYKNGLLQNQPGANRDYQSTLESSILKFDYSSFTQIVLVGKATHVSFMKLNSGQRRQFVEQILNLAVFSTMNKLHTQKLSALKESLMEMKSDISVAQEKVNIRTRHIIQLEREALEAADQEIEKIKVLQSELSTEINDLLDRKSDLFSQLVEVDGEIGSLKSKSKTLNGMQGKLTFKSDDISKQIKQISDQDVCPTCGQDITDDFKHDKTHSLQNQLDQLQVAQTEISEKIVDLDSKIAEIEKKISHNEKYQREIAAIEALIKDKKNQISRLEGSMVQSRSSSVDKIQEEKDILDALEKELADLQRKRAHSASELEYYNLMSNMLKDNGIKATIIRRFIPIINHYINSNLARLGFFAKFSLDENFEETIQARGIDTLSYNNFSEGEKLRIDMSILLAWREVAKLQNSVSTNLLFFDEVFDASLDGVGTEALAILLNEMKQTNIFIISHAPEKIADKVRSQIIFHKENGFSRMKA